MPEAIELKPLPPAEAVDFFQKKGYKIGFDWRDVEKAEHAVSFTVAKAMRNDILQDIRAGVDKAIADGITFETFSKDLSPVLQEKGWWGKKLMTDPKTGEEKLVQLGSPRRLKIIYDTNLRSAYAAGQWERIQRVKARRPYLRYIGSVAENPREQHKKFYDLVLPVDHPFWSKFYPPNGWRCQCSVQQLSQRDLDRLGLDVTSDDDIPPADERVVLNKRTGELQKIPTGIDAGFDFNVGQARMKSITPPPLDKPLSIPYTGNPSGVPFPKARTESKSILYPEGLEDAEYVDRFLNEFGKTQGGFIDIKDVAGESLVISDALFKTATGRLKISRDLRYRYLGLLAKTIKDPDEIWHVWEEYPKNRWTLRRKYLAKWKVDGEDAPGFVLFDTSADGWSGITTFKPQKTEYIERQRKGALVYQRRND